MLFEILSIACSVSKLLLFRELHAFFRAVDGHRFSAAHRPTNAETFSGFHILAAAAFLAPDNATSELRNLRHLVVHGLGIESHRSSPLDVSVTLNTTHAFALVAKQSELASFLSGPKVHLIERLARVV